MEYFKISQKENLPNIIKPILPSVSDLWSETNPFFMPGKAKEPYKELTFLPFYKGHCFVIHDAIKNIWQNYQTGGRYRPCAMGSVEQRKVEIYAVMFPLLIDGIHEETEYFKNGEIKKLVLDQKYVGYHKVFGIKSWHLVNLIISEDVLEKMLQENITEFLWEKVNILP